jgi:hypothetical protein
MDERFAAIGPAEQYVNRAALRVLAKHLRPDEHVRRAVQGHRGKKTGLLVATDLRVVWLQHRLLRRPSSLEVPMRLARIDAEAGEHGWSITVEGGKRPLLIQGVRTKSAQAFSTYARMRRDGIAEFEQEEPSRDPHIDRLVKRGSMSKEEAEWARRTR